MNCFIQISQVYGYSWAWWGTPVIPALGRWRQEDLEFKPDWAIQGDPVSKTKQNLRLELQSVRWSKHVARHHQHTAHSESCLSPAVEERGTEKRWTPAVLKIVTVRLSTSPCEHVSKRMKICFFKILRTSRCWWLTPVVLAPWEVEIGKIVVQSQFWQIVWEDPVSKNN
jgi:hypothetical protein